MTMTHREKLLAIPRKRLRQMGVPEDMTALDVIEFFSLPDDDDTMHSQKRVDGEASGSKEG